MASQDLPERISDGSIRVIRNAADQLQQERTQFETFIAKMLDGLEEMRRQLVLHEEGIAETEGQLAKRQEQLDQALEEASAASRINKQTQVEVDRLTGELQNAHDAHERLSAERDDLKARLNDAVDELSAVADALDLVQSTERELVKTRQELSDAKDQLRGLKSRPEASDVETLQKAIEKLTAELRGSREESARLNEKVAEQKQMLDEQREKMSKNLDGLRDSLKNRVKSLRE